MGLRARLKIGATSQAAYWCGVLADCYSGADSAAWLSSLQKVSASQAHKPNAAPRKHAYFAAKEMSS